LINDFKDLFSEEEWKAINQAEDIDSRFYYYWTAKEAVSKSEGKGLSARLKNIEIGNGRALFENKVWYYKNISLLPNYMLQVASDKKIENIEIEQKHF
jgi:4'-phosphopantetheinyl transferase